jgi:hypothetical protein
VGTPPIFHHTPPNFPHRVFAQNAVRKSQLNAPQRADGFHEGISPAFVVARPGRGQRSPGARLPRYTWQRMAWGFRRSLKLGPIRVNLSKSGVGYSIGGRGFRVGKDAKGRSYTAASIPGTGLYSRTYSSQGDRAGGGTAEVSGASPGRSNGVALVLGMLALAFMAGGLVVFMLMSRPTPPSVTPPAALSVPVAPAPPIPAKQKRGHRSLHGSKRASASEPGPN